MNKPILLLEINEVPWRILKRYLGRKEYPELDYFFSRAQNYTSIAVEEGELSPWITWPTVHRGMSAKEHKIQYLGQDPKSFRGKSIWQEVKNAGFSIGVFGSLQSWPPIDPGPQGFYVPDTFAQDETCVPSFLEPLQAFNLEQVRANGRVIRSSPLWHLLDARFLSSLMEAGIRPQTLLQMGGQILAEKINPNLRARRAIFQTVLFWDVFRNLYQAEQPPLFSSFFTNHIASIQHRFWDSIFPEDFPDKKVKDNSSLLDFAFQVLENILTDVRGFQQKNKDLQVVFATSMGQGPKHRPQHQGIELSISHTDKILEAAGLQKKEFQILLAMVPQVAVQIGSAEKRTQVKKFLQELKTSKARSVFHTEEKGESLSITLVTPDRDECLADFFQHKEQKLSFSQLGITAFEVDAGTGYHIPEGIFSYLGPMPLALPEGSKIPTDQIKSLLLQQMGIPLSHG